MRKGRITLIELLVVFGIIAVLLALCGAGFLMEVPFTLAAGWIFYLVRVVPQTTWNWSGFFTALICLITLAFGLQWFLRWFYQQLQAKRGNPTPRDWSWSWTLRILGLVVLMFVAGISAIGVTHQTAWLVTSPSPLLEGGIRGPANRTQSMNNLHQMGIAVHDYHDKNMSFPEGMTYDKHGNMLHGWLTRLLPYIEEDRIYKRINMEIPWNAPNNAQVFREEIQIYLNPRVIYRNAGVETRQSQDGFALSHYAGNARILGSDVAWKFKDITDGTSNTLLAGEAAGNFKPWGYPANARDPALGINQTPDGFGAPWGVRGAGEAIFMFADGSVRLIKEDIDPATLKALSTPNGGESVKLEDY
jgi:hypothetical protein